MSKKMLIKSLQQSPIVKKGSYFYVVHPITDGVPEISPGLLSEVTDEMGSQLGKWMPFEKIVTMEAMGIPLASALSLKLDIPFNIIRKRTYGLPDEVPVHQVTGYSKAKLFINGLNKGEEIVIVDDVLSTGGTLKAVLSALKKIGVVVKGVFIAVDKGNVSREIADEFDIMIKSLVTIDVVKGKVVVK